MRTFLAGAVTAGLVLSLGGLASGIANAETAYTVGGAKMPGVPWYDYTNRSGAAYFPNVDRILVDYPAGVVQNLPEGAPPVGPSVDIGTDALDAAIHNDPQGAAVVIGLSEGGLVLDAEQARLANDPTAPAPNKLSFATFGDPAGRHGFGESFLTTVFAPGTRMPFIDYSIPAPVQTQYDSTAVVTAYDGVADFPDRPENLVSTANALMGALFFHTGVAFSDPSEVPPQNIVVKTNSRGATQTTYLVPPKFLPLTWPLREAGVPNDVVDQLDGALRPTVDAGYSRNDNAASRPVNIDPAGGLPPITDGASVLEANLDVGGIDVSGLDVSGVDVDGIAQQVQALLPPGIG